MLGSYCPSNERGGTSAESSYQLLGSSCFAVHLAPTPSSCIDALRFRSIRPLLERDCACHAGSAQVG